LDEAAYLAAAVPPNRCPSTDSLEVLDIHPHLRLALEDTWTDPVGRVYREVPADKVSRWPGRIARTFKSFLRIGRDPAQVFELLDLLHELDAGTQVLRMTMVGCRHRGELTSAITYYRMLADELREVTYQPNPEIEIACAEPRNHPRFECDEVKAGAWTAKDNHGSEPTASPSHRALRTSRDSPLPIRLTLVGISPVHNDHRVLQLRRKAVDLQGYVVEPRIGHRKELPEIYRHGQFLAGPHFHRREVLGRLDGSRSRSEAWACNVLRSNHELHA
jgi:hypothetical protein